MGAFLAFIYFFVLPIKISDIGYDKICYDLHLIVYVLSTLVLKGSLQL